MGISVCCRHMMIILVMVLLYNRITLVLQRTLPTGALVAQVAVSPYATLTRQRNCGGRGLCATCGVWLDDAVAAEHWHDRLAARFGYPRLSCQIHVTRALTVRLVSDKIIWGRSDPRAA